MVRDSQRSRVYTWEGECVQGLARNQRLSLAECGVLVAKACQHYGIPVPPITDGRGRRSACWSRWRGIALPLFARTEVIVLHEVSHAIVNGGAVAAHGPEFVRVFIELLAHFGIAKKGDLLKSARQFGIKVASPGSCPQPSGWKERLRAEMESVKQKYVRLYVLSEVDVSKAISQIIAVR